MTVSGEEFQFKTLPDQGCSFLKTDGQQGIATVQGSIFEKLQPVRTVASTTATALPATAAKSAAKEQPVPHLAASLPAPPLHIISPIDSNKTVLQLSASQTDPDTVQLLRNGLAEAAAKHGSLRLAFISLLAYHPHGLRTIKKHLDKLQERVPQFKYPQDKGEFEQALKKVAAFRPPGSYALLPGLEREIESLVEEAKIIEAARKAEEENRVAAAKEKLVLANNNKRKTPTSLPTSKATAGDGTSNSEDSERSLSLAARRKVTPSLPSTSPTHDEDDGDDGGTATATAASRPLSSSSRGSGGADESWVLEHAQRLPEPAPLITTATAYNSANAEFHRRYLVYFKLHQLLSANRRDFEALQAAVDDTSSIQEKEKIEAEVERLWARRARRSKRWEAAFHVLHQELAEWKDALSKYASSMISNDTQRNNAGGSSGLSDEEM